MNDLQAAYKILRLEPGASLSEVEEAFQDATQHWHPNHFPPEPYIQEKAQAKLGEINTAYRQLKTHFLEQDSKEPPGAAPAAVEPDWRLLPGILMRAPGKSFPRLGAARVWVREHAGHLLAGLVLAAGLMLSPVIYAYLSSPAKPVPVLASKKLTVTPAPGSQTLPEGKAAPRTVAPRTSHHYFTLGSTPDEVWALQGPPKYLSATTWKYGLSTVTFKNRRVVAYANFSRNLRVRLTPKSPVKKKKPRFYFTVGSSQDRVLMVQGTPSMVVADTWKYGESEVKFRNSRVVSYDNTAQNLQVKAAAKTRKATRTVKRKIPHYFTLGSSKRRVLAVQGRPTYVWGNTWWYGYSRVDFYHDRVIGFADLSRNLKARFF